MSQLQFISWAPYCSRSDGIARRLGGQSHMVYSPGWGSHILTVAFKYLSQTLKTLWLLLRSRPDVVFVMAPPVVACVPVWLYCRLFDKPFVIDAHTGAFLNPRWSRLQRIQKFFSRRAVTTIVTNEHLAGLVKAWGADATIVQDVPLCFPEPADVRLLPGTNLTLVASFDHDEPIAEFLDAASLFCDVNFFVTGNFRKLSASVRDHVPANVHFTGFLSDEEYVGHILASDAILALTTVDHTMQRAAYEAIYLKRPVLTSDFPVLRKAFPIATIHATPTTDGIRQGISTLLSRLDQLTTEAKQLRNRKWADWEATSAQLMQRLAIASGRSHNADVEPPACPTAAEAEKH